MPFFTTTWILRNGLVSAAGPRLTVLPHPLLHSIQCAEEKAKACSAFLRCSPLLSMLCHCAQSIYTDSLKIVTFVTAYPSTQQEQRSPPHSTGEKTGRRRGLEKRKEGVWMSIGLLCAGERRAYGRL